jgi:hypothetical protein
MVKYIDICHAILAYGNTQQELGKAVGECDYDNLKEIMKRSMEKYIEVMSLVEEYKEQSNGN